MAIVSPACNGGRLWIYFYTFLLFLHCSGGGFPCGVALLQLIQGVDCRGLAVKEWNHGVGGGVGVVPMIGQYFGLGCFSIARWPGQQCHCLRSLGACVSIHYLLCGFHREICPAIGLGTCDGG